MLSCEQCRRMFCVRSLRGLDLFGRGEGGGGQKQRTLMRCLAAWGDAYKQRDSVISAHPAIRDASCVAHTQKKKRRNEGRETGSDRERPIERERGKEPGRNREEKLRGSQER